MHTSPAEFNSPYHPTPIFHPFRINTPMLHTTHGPPHPPLREPTNLPDPSLDYFHIINIQRAIASSFAEKTCKNYSSVINAFLAWCENNKIHESLRFPASEYVLCAYIASLASTKSKSSINASLAALKAWHDASGKTWNNSPRLALVSRGAAASTPTSSIRPPRKPVTAEMLIFLHNHLNLHTPIDAAILATALTAFWGQCRLGELLGTAKLKHAPTKLPSRDSLGPPISADGSLELSLPSTKTKYSSGETIALTAQRNPINPVSAITHLFTLTPDIPASAHLFAHTIPGRPGTIHSLTKETFIARVNAIWKSAGFHTVSGHSFRIGGTTHLLKAGIAPEIVRSMGRWASNAHFRYWRDKTSLAIDHAEYVADTPSKSKSHPIPRPREAPSRRTPRSAPLRGRPY